MAQVETVTLSDLDIYRAALHVAQRADELMAAGDKEGRAVWHRIERPAVMAALSFGACQG